MKTTSELLKDCKIKLKITSDYELAKKLKMERTRISEYMSGKRHPTVYALVRIAECLGLDALELIAEYEGLSAKNDTEKEFWKDFLLRAKNRVRPFMLALLCTLILLAGYQQAEKGALFFRRGKYA